MDAEPHVVLVGMMGAGKSAVGALLAERMERPLVDTDELVVAIAGRPVSEIFTELGEPAFRALERQAVMDATRSSVPLVIACGGGAVLDAENRRRLRAAGTVVWLRADASTLAARVGEGTGRPLLSGNEAPVATLGRLAEIRTATYEAAAHVIVDTDGLTVGEVADAVAGVVP